MTKHHHQHSAQYNPLTAVALATACAVALALSLDPALLAWTGLRAYMLLISVVPGLLLALGCAGWGDVMLRLCLPRDATPDTKVDSDTVNGADEIDKVNRDSSVNHDYQPAKLGGLYLSERALFAFACGIGMVSCMALVLGMTGTLNQLSAALVLVIGVAAGLPLWRVIAGRCVCNSSDIKKITASVESLVMPVSAASAPGVSLPVMVIGTLLAISMTMVVAVSLTPPLIFDVTEYHLGAWTDYWNQSTARFAPMPHNFYARFPFPIESLYYLGLAVAPYHDAAPKVFNALCVIACAALAGLLARRLGGGRAGMALAALVAIAHPVMFDVSIDALIDAPVALLVATSVYSGLLATGKFGTGAPAVAPMIIPATFLFGAALAAKYTVAQVFLLPWLALVLWPMLRAQWKRPGLIAVAGAIALAPCVLWLGKNVYFYGNPLEPFFVRWFRPNDAAGIAREAFYIESHFPQSPLTLEYWTSLMPRLREYQWVLLAACAGWIFRGRNAAAMRLLILAAGAWLLWNLVRESQNRFLLPAMVLLAPVSACGALAFPTRMLRRVVAGVLILFSTAQIIRYALTLHQSEVIEYVLDFGPSNRQTTPISDEPTPREKYYETNLGDLGRMINEMNRSLPADAKVLMVYEARPFLFRHPTRYNVVWDDSALLDIIRPAKSTGEAWQLLKDAGITQLLVNRQELLRYIQQYARPAQLRRLGFRSGDDPRLAWSVTDTPEDLYPPFYRDRDWARLRPVVHGLLDEINAKADIRHGAPAGAAAKPLDITLTPVK